MPKFITKELDPEAFQAGIWISKANTLSPLLIKSERGANWQSLKDSFEEQGKLTQFFANFAIIGGIAQYTAENNSQAGLVTRLDVYFRHPEIEEMRYDFDHFGEQVVAGPKWDELDEKEKKTNTYFEFLGEKFVFTGPPRVYQGIFATSIFPSQAPENVAELVQEVDELAEKCKENSASDAMVTPELIVKQNYLLFAADKGRVIQLPFKNPTDYDLSKAKDFGLVEVKDGKLLYHPAGDRTQTIDFSPAMYRE